MDGYLELVKFQPFIAKKYLQSRYFSNYEKSVKMRFYSKEISSLYDVLPNVKLNRQDLKAHSKRKSYLSSLREENSRGLPYQQNLYEFYNYPIVFEEKWTPEENSKRSSDEESEDEKLEEQKKSKHKCHLIFLLHGYNGKGSDMANLKNALLKRFPEARIYTCKSNENADTQERKDSTLSSIVKDGIKSLAKLVGREMKKEIDRIEESTEIQKISMIGHSLGGLVLRAALKYLLKN